MLHAGLTGCGTELTKCQTPDGTTLGELFRSARPEFARLASEGEPLAQQVIDALPS